MKKFDKLSARAQTVLQVLCSNYRDNFNVTALFSCRKSYGVEKFSTEINKYLTELKKAKYLSDFYIAEPMEENESYRFNVSVTVSMSVEEMSRIAVNSQSVYIPS